MASRVKTSNDNKTVVREHGEDLLVQKAIHKNAEAFAQLYDTHVEKVYRAVFYKVLSRCDAEDITQEVFVKAWKAIGRYKQRGVSFAAWLITIAHNQVMDHFRSKRKDTVPLDEAPQLPDNRESPESSTESAMESRRIRQAILKLKGDKQQVLIMRFIDGCSYAEVAGALKKSEGAIRVIQYRALFDLKKILESDEHGR